MDFNEAVFKTVKTFQKDRYLIHCYITDDSGSYFVEKNLTLKGFYNSSLEECLLNLVREQYVNYDYITNIVTDIANKLVTLTVTTAYGFGKYTIDKIEKIQNEE